MSLNPTEGRMTVSERAEFKKLDAIIEKGNLAFLEVGTALLRMQEAKLYRETWTTFKDYLSNRMSISEAHAYRLMDAAKIKNSPIGEKIQNEAQAREVAKAPPKKRAQVVKTAEKIAKKSGKPMSAKVLAEARQQIVEGEVVPKPKPEKPPKSGSEKLSPAKILDSAYKAHFPPLCRALTEAAKAIGSEGPNFKAADKGLNDFSNAIKPMREGKP